ncbi:GspH/FimT family pseudopilin [Pseudomonadota bacterium]
MDVACLHNADRQTGFTLVELMTTLVVMIMVIATGVPAMQKLFANQQMVSSVNTMASHLHLARSEAVKRGLRAVLCPSLDGETCLKSTQWQRGFILFADENANRKREAGEELLRIFQSNNKNPQIRITSTEGRRWVRYQAMGDAPGSNLTLTFCDSHDFVDPKAIIISNTGRPRISTAKPNGGPLDC